MTRTRAEALEGAARCIVEGLRVSDSLPIEEAARRAMQAGGPSYEELLDLIRARRARLGMTERQERRCPHCGAWFNTTPQQDAHERDCDQRPTDPTPVGTVAPARVQLLPLVTHTNHPKEGTREPAAA